MFIMLRFEVFVLTQKLDVEHTYATLLEVPSFRNITSYTKFLLANLVLRNRMMVGRQLFSFLFFCYTEQVPHAFPR